MTAYLISMGEALTPMREVVETMDEIIPARRAAKLASIRQDRLLKLHRVGKFPPAVGTGARGGYLFSRAAVVEWLAQRHSPARDPAWLATRRAQAAHARSVLAAIRAAAKQSPEESMQCNTPAVARAGE